MIPNNEAQFVHDVIADAIRPRPPMTVEEWATRYALPGAPSLAHISELRMLRLRLDALAAEVAALRQYVGTIGDLASATAVEVSAVEDSLTRKRNAGTPRRR